MGTSTNPQKDSRHVYAMAKPIAFQPCQKIMQFLGCAFIQYLSQLRGELRILFEKDK
jgi:hypothetical protein